jgi:hypothetical protein
MKKLTISLLLASTLLAPCAGGREVKMEIGRWSHPSGQMSFSVTESNGSKRAVIFVTDEHVIESNYFWVSKKDLLKIPSLIDETIAELDDGQPTR